MCELATIGLALSVVGTITSTLGAVNQAQGQKSAYEYQAAVNRNNAIQAGYQADDAIERGQEEERKTREKTRQLIGRQRSIFGAAGLQTDSGTPLLVQEDTAEIGELDALTVRNNSEREAHALRFRAENFEANARMNSFAADGISPGMAGATTLLAGAGNIAAKYQKFSFYKGRG